MSVDIHLIPRFEISKFNSHGLNLSVANGRSASS